MNAADIMTTDVITVLPDTGFHEIVSLFLKHKISAVPVVDEDQYVLGIISEGDLVRRVENDTGQRRAGRIAVFFSPINNADNYLKTHGHKASDIMNSNPILMREDIQLHKIAQLIEKHRIRCVPVTRDGRLVGIVSRANLLHGLIAKGNNTDGFSSVDDRTIREQLLLVLSDEIGLRRMNVVVINGVVQLWGLADSETEKHAARVAAENIPGVKGVENHMGHQPPSVSG